MFHFILKKLIGAIPTVMGVALVVFLLFNVVGGDPALQILGKHATPAQMEDVRREFGFDKPLPVQFLNYLYEIVTFDFGRSYATRQRISDMILEGLGPTLSLAIPAFLITTIISLLIGLFAAYFRGRFWDRFSVVFSVVGMSVPSLGYILFGQYILAYQLNWFPISGFNFEWPGRIQYLILPAIIWIALSLGHDVRFYRTALVEETEQDYVRTARAKGLNDFNVYFRHVLRNTLIPIVTHMILEIPILILGSFLLESFFGIPGVGSITIDALHNSDLPVIKAMATVTSLIYILGNILVDVVYTWVDPRMKLK